MNKNKKEEKMKSKVKKMLWLELGIILLVLILFIIIKLNMIRFIPPCPINKMFGILCPSCGGTRCVINFAIGNFKESFYYHPIFFITIIYLLFINVLYIWNSFRKKEIASFLYPKTKFWIIFIIILLLFTIIRNSI